MRVWRVACGVWRGRGAAGDRHKVSEISHSKESR
jgi:hypothetical protein